MDIRRVDPAYRAHFGDHTTLDLLYDNERMRAQLDAVEEVGPEKCPRPVSGV